MRGFISCWCIDGELINSDVTAIGIIGAGNIGPSIRWHQWLALAPVSLSGSENMARGILGSSPAASCPHNAPIVQLLYHPITAVLCLFAAISYVSCFICYMCSICFICIIPSLSCVCLQLFHPTTCHTSIVINSDTSIVTFKNNNKAQYLDIS